MNRIKVLQICFAYPPSFSGYGRQLKTINSFILSRPDNNIDISVITAFDAKEHIDNRNYRVFSMLSKGRSEYFHKKIVYYTYLFYLTFMLLRKAQKCDVIHCVKAGPEGAVAVFISKLFKKKLIVKVAQDEMSQLNIKKNIFRKLRFNVICKADYVIALSELIKSDLICAGASESTILKIPNAVETNQFKPLSSREEKKSILRALKLEEHIDDTIIVFAGAISIRKGIRDIISAMEKWPPNEKLVFIFIGPDKNEIEEFSQFIHADNLTGELIKKYFGYTDIPEQFFKIADALILPSYSEGLPNVVLESMSCGAPVIVSDIPVCKEIIDDTVGNVIPIGDSDAILSSIMSVHKNTSAWQHKGENARRRIEEYYGVNKIAQEYIRLYEGTQN